MAIVAIPGANGAQQQAVSQEFRSAGWTVKGTSRAGGEGLVKADLETGEGLAEAFEGADVVAVTLPQDHRNGAMTRIAQTIGECAARAGAGRIVLNVGGTIDAQGTGPMFDELRNARAAIRASGVSVGIVQPTVFMENLLAPWIAGAIVADGVFAYPAPADAPIAWMSHATLADFIVAAAGTDTDEVSVGGPDNLTGPEAAAILGAHLGRSIVYHEQPLADFAAGLDYAMGPPAGARLSSLYARLIDDRTIMARDGSAARRLGVTPEPLDAFLRRVGFPTG